MKSFIEPKYLQSNEVNMDDDPLPKRNQRDGIKFKRTMSIGSKERKEFQSWGLGRDKERNRQIRARRELPSSNPSSERPFAIGHPVLSFAQNRPPRRFCCVVEGSPFQGTSTHV